MGEPAVAEAATSERDVLLATKLTVPGLRADLVPQSRSAAWPGCSGRLALRTPPLVPGGALPRRCRAWSSS